MNRTVRHLTAPRSSQAARLSILAIVLACGIGCTYVPAEPREQLAHPGQEAADIAEARALDLRDSIRIYARERADLERQRDALLRDAALYRDKSADVWTEVGLSARERVPMAEEYDASAEDAEAKAQRVQERIDSYGGEIARFEIKRTNELYEAREYKKMIERIPD